MASEPKSRIDAQREADRLRAFRDQLAELEAQNVLALTPEQRTSFEAHFARTLAALAETFDIDTSDSQKRLSWGLRIASTLGGLAFCAALILLFQRVWGLLGTPVQLAIGIAAPLAALALTEIAARRERTLYFAGLFALVALGAFVLNLTLMGTVFNLSPTESALIPWGVFSMLLAYRYGLRLLLLAGIGFLVCWTSAYAGARFGIPWDMLFERIEHFLIGGIVAFWVPSFVRHARHADFPPVYRAAGAFAAYAALLPLSEGSWSYLPMDRDAQKVVYGLFAIALSSGAIALGIRRGWNGIVYISTAFFVLFLFLRLHHWFWDAMPNYVFFALLGGIAVGLMRVFQRIRTQLEAGQQ